MSNKDFLSLGLGSGVVTVTVQDVQVKEAPIGKNGETAEKIVLNCTNGSSQKLKVVDEAWIRHRKSQFVNKGLWLTLDDNGQAVNPMCALGKVMSYNGVTTLKELQGKEVKGIYKVNGFLALLTEEYEDNQEFVSSR